MLALKKLLLAFIYAWYRSLPQEIIERVAAGVDFGDHLVDIAAELLDVGLVDGGDEYARGLLLRYPAVFQLVQRAVLLAFRG